MTDYTYKLFNTNFLVKDVSAGTGLTYVKPTTLVDASGALLGSAANPIFTSAGGSGGSTVVTQPTAANLNAQVIGSVASGAAIPTNPIFIAGSDGTNVQPLKTNTSGNLQIAGSIASGVADSGNPVKVGGIYQGGSAPTFTTGQRGDIQITSKGEIAAALVGSGTAGADATSNTINLSFASGALNIAGRPLGVVGFGLNGTTWDRLRTIQGAVVDGTGLGVTAVEQAGALFNNITTATTTTVKSGKGILHKLIVNTVAASATITMYDNTTGSGTKIGTITNPVSLLSMGPLDAIYDLQFSTGLTIVTTGTQDITVVYR